MHAWRHAWTQPQLQACRQPQLDRAIDSITAQHNRLTVAYKLLAKNAKDEKLDQIASQVTDYTFANRALKAWKGIKALPALGGSAKLNGARSFPALLDKHGQPTTSPEHSADTFLEHFAELGIADVVDYETVTKQHNANNCMKVPQKKHMLESSSQNVITKHRFEVQFNHNKQDKAGGTDGLSKQLTKVAPREMARHVHPYLTKAALRCTEALEHKGGLVHNHFKTKGSQRHAASFRIIMLENDIIKHHHRYLRERLLNLTTVGIHLQIER